MKNRGFTLLEVLVYIAIFALIVVFTLDGIFSTGKAVRKLRLVRARDAAVVQGFDAIDRAVRSSGSVVLASSTLQTSPGVLALDSGAQFKLENDSLMSRDTPNGTWATTTTASFSELIFRRIHTPVSDGVRIEAYANGVQYLTTSVTRGSY